MSYHEYRGNLFHSNAQTLVNTVNCVGVMGKGVALEFRRRFPLMYDEYRAVCRSGELRPGKILPYLKGQPWVLNFAVKDDWRYPSRIEWVEGCLKRFVESYQLMEIKSVALPWIGAMNGRLPWNRVHQLIRKHLMNLPNLDVEVIEFDPSASDPLFDNLRQALQRLDAPELSHAASLNGKVVDGIIQAVRLEEVRSLAELTDRVPMGKVSVDNLYRFLIDYPRAALPPPQQQLRLFE